MADKVIWNEDKNRPFINPYNFVSTTQRVKVNPVEKGNLTGYVTCTLRVEDMLAIPDIAQNPNSQSFDFFPAIGNPTIPGSELRGCIRSAYEAVTGSCYSVLNSNLLSKRKDNPDGNRNAGLLMKKDGKWIIYEAWYKKTNGKKCKEWENGVHCKLTRKWFKCADMPTIGKTYFHSKMISSGAVCIDEDIDKLIKIYEIYYEGIKKSEEGDAPELRNIICDYREQLLSLKEIDNSDVMIPVFFEIDEYKLLTYFSPAHTGRIIFEKTASKLLEKYDSNFCKGIDNKYCPACSLFGTLGENNPLASRLRFTDATEKENGSVHISERYVILPELSSPKLSTVEFYTTHGEIKKNENLPVWDYDDKGVELRGRKFYFHRLPKKADVLGPRQIETKVAESGSLFTFKLYFDRIKEEQLQQLLWVLTIGENQSDSKQMHKIGMGKPVGYGSVKITVDKICLRKFDKISLAYSVVEKQYDEYMQEFKTENYFNMKALSDFKTITNYSLTIREDNGIKSEIIPISYPIAEREPDIGEKNSENLKAGHQWFTGNRNKNAGAFATILPKLSNNIETLRMNALHGKNIYEAKIFNTHEYKKEQYVDLELCSIKKNNRINIKMKYFPAEIKDDIQTAIITQKKVYVSFVGTRNNRKIFHFYSEKISE